MENMAENFAHIKGWGIDADPENDPTYPMKNYTGDDHKRLNYERPPQQPVDVEVLHSNERPNVTAAFGTSSPPKGLSGLIRRYAFKYSENSLAHWLSLMIADRVNVAECFLGDLTRGHVPNVIAERGLKAEWKYNRKGVLKKAAAAAIIATAVTLIYQNNKNGKK